MSVAIPTCQCWHFSEERDGYYAAGRMPRAADLVDSLGQENNPEWKTVAINSNGEMVAPNGSIGFRWVKGNEPRAKARGYRCRN